MWPASPGSCSSFSSRARATAEVDRRAGERVVHRHDRVAVARDAAPVAERRVERLAERERGVLGGVVRRRSRDRRALEHEVEAGVEGELLEQVVVEPGAGRDAHAARAVEREPHGEARLGGRAQRARRGARRRRRPATGRSSTRASASTSRSSSSASSTETRIASGYARTTMPWRSSASPSARAVVDGHVEEVRVRLERREPERAQRRRRAARAPRAPARTSGGVGERRERERGRERRDRRRRLARVQLGGDVARGERVADARAREPEQLRERAQHDDAVVEQRHGGLAAVLEVRLVDDERPRVRERAERRRSGCSGGTRT